MAEIGIVASVFGVAGVGFRLSLLLNAVGCEIASAGMEIHSISKSVTLFSLMLKQVGQALQASDSVHSSEALETAQEISIECEKVFDEIREMLDKVTSRKSDGSLSPSIQQRFKWCFKKARVQYLLAQLESLKMSLLLMLQILQLGKLMAATPQSEQKEEVAVKNDIIAQERAETQNLVIVRYWQINRLDRLYTAAEHEEAEDRKKQIEGRNNGNAENSQLAIEAPPEYSISTALIKLPIVSLGELDATLNQIRESPREMLRVSESVIDPLLGRWTRWQEARDRQGVRLGSRYMPSVHNLYESDEEKARQYNDFHDREDSSGGYYLEGTTTDWRKPHSAAAKQEAAKLRKKYAGLQPSISVESSDAEDNQGPRRPKKPPPSRHVIDSSTETSDSERDQPRQRRSSYADSSNDKRSRYLAQRPNPPPMYGNGGDARANAGGRNNSSPNGTPQSPPRSSISAPRSPGAHRPMTTPVQTQYSHAYTSPLPPVHTSNAPNPYAPHSPYSPNPNSSLHPPAYQGHYNNPQQYPPRYMPPQGYRVPVAPQQRPFSREEKRPRSPSRHSGHSVHSQRSIEELKKAERNRKHKNLGRSATKGVLGAFALDGFLEALEGLEL
ncbi:hypothetical protein EPUS_02912 [Endocarpon pusillum Z07020]|uniref:Fungal N-terminal domain-containing protein n=1 Tax=Endocarpon pusillum (strain Z07020 / HMAS-L-300199) TaxID=1263415 RepID=U1GJX8_ENDPU|nr:uncharacterized protein EPUS_02912 [Endocarpon pusillum Z07020]ERF72121.1 hypothetical protein EPUS_02912 [Endocarpon pusillum Z07020]